MTVMGRGVLAEVRGGARVVGRRLDIDGRGGLALALPEQATVEMRVATLGRWMTVEMRVTVAATV
jgi:hypothetical protein